MRLLDRIVDEGFSSGDARMILNRKSVSGALQKAQLVVVDNVVDYYCGQIDRRRENEEWVTTEDFPCVMPPFPNVFLDFRIRPPSYLSPAFESGGVWMLTSPKEAAPDWLETFNVAHLPVFFSEEVAWHLSCSIFLLERGSKRALDAAGLVLPVAKDGSIPPFENKIPFGADLRLDIARCGGEGEKSHVMQALFHCALCPALLALSFMHCRNVKVVQEAPPPKLSKIHQKKAGKPLLRYRVLQIDHMKEILEKEGKASETGLKRALHICRGHFSTYGQDGKGLLFGKHRGRFWIPMHTRGDPKEGVVVKDYKVK